jgi:hypothetical protein
VRLEIVAAIEDCHDAGDCALDDETSSTNCIRLIARWPSAISDQAVGELHAPNFRNLFKLDCIKHQVLPRSMCGPDDPARTAFSPARGALRAMSNRRN